tara:strand:+ start:348 stop:857 length:510 start_codon:yes stop_codon:yes gene_type:complete
MSQSLDIIRHILDENLIDAKKATEGYLNDILSGAIKEQYKEVAPSLVEKADGGKGGVVTTANTMTAAPAAGAETAAMQQGSNLVTDQGAANDFVSGFLDAFGALLPGVTMEMIMNRAFAAGFAEAGTTSMTYILNAMSEITDQGVGKPISDPIDAIRDRRDRGGPGNQG